MTLPLTTETLRAAYDFLNTTPPFNRWNLPDGEDVVFKVVRAKLYGWHSYSDGKHLIAVSTHRVGRVETLVETMAHEMIHVHEEHARACRADVEHSAAFNKWADAVCRYHGFDRKRF